MEGVDLYLHVIPLGVAAAVTPTLIALQLLVVCAPRWLGRALGVLAANALAFGLVIALVSFGFAKLPDAGTGHHEGFDSLRFGCGLVLVVMSVYFLLPHRQLQERTQAAIERRVDHAHSWVFFGLAFYFSITDLSSFIVIAPGLRDVSVSTADLSAKIGALVVLLALSLMATGAPLILRLVLGRRGGPWLQRAYTWVMRNNLRVVGVMLLAVGLWFAIGALAQG